MIKEVSSEADKTVDGLLTKTAQSLYQMFSRKNETYQELYQEVLQMEGGDCMYWWRRCSGGEDVKGVGGCIWVHKYDDCDDDAENDELMVIVTVVFDDWYVWKDVVVVMGLMGPIC